MVERQEVLAEIPRRSYEMLRLTRLKYAENPSTFADRTVNLTALAMQRAIRNRAPAQALIFHSDRGIEYAAYRYHAILTQHGIRPSMNRPRYCQDNAHMESFFHTIETEWIRGRTFATFAELEAALTAYIRFYNHHRLHSGIDYHTPEEYERVMA